MFRLIILTALTSGLRAPSTTFTAATEMTIKAVDFEVFGRVQGVFFRKTTEFYLVKPQDATGIDYNHLQMKMNSMTLRIKIGQLVLIVEDHKVLDINQNTGCFPTKISSRDTERNMEQLMAMDFEVYGNVQGVYFRVYTKEQAEKLNLRGWCKNTAQGTVLGHVQGPSDKVETMMHWLRNTGSPSSKIERAEFKNQKEITEYTYEHFGILKD